MNRLYAPFSARHLIWVLLLLLYLPFAWMIFSSVNLSGSGGAFDWYEKVFANSSWMQAMGRSALVGIGASILATALGLGAVVASRGRMQKLLEFFSVVALILPELVFALSLLSWFVVLKFELSLWTVLIAHVTFSLSFSYFLILSRFRQIDRQLFEAAEDLGASAWQVLIRVQLPLLGPSLAVSALLCFLLSFDDFLISFFVIGVGSDTLPLTLYSSMKIGLSPELHALATVMAVVSSVVMYLVLTFGDLVRFARR
jgi:spermidine/putrescine transport system permease protein